MPFMQRIVFWDKLRTSHRECAFDYVEVKPPEYSLLHRISKSTLPARHSALVFQIYTATPDSRGHPLFSSCLGDRQDCL
jgi:hypothetical protein